MGSDRGTIAKLASLPEIPVTLRGIPWNLLMVMVTVCEALVEGSDKAPAALTTEDSEMLGAIKRSVVAMREAMRFTEVDSAGAKQFSELGKQLGIPPPKLMGYQWVDENGQAVGKPVPTSNATLSEEVLRRMDDNCEDPIWPEEPNEAKASEESH